MISQAHSYFDQFEIIRLVEIHPFGNLDVSITNSTLVMLLGTGYFVFIYSNSIENGLLVPGRNQTIIETWYEAFHDLIRDNIGESGMRFFPFILTLFIFLALMNLFGLVPYVFTPTSHVAVTFGLSVSIFLGANMLGLYNYNVNFMSMFMPNGAPLGMSWFLVLIEFVSHVAKGVILGLRLGANIMAGHLLIAIISSFAFQMLTSGIVTITLLGLVPLFLGFFICVLEIAVAVIQAYVFSLLTVIYLSEAIHLH